MRTPQLIARTSKITRFLSLAKIRKIVHKTVEKLILLLYPSLENANVLALPTNKTDAAQGACAWS